uniref:Caprin-1_dimer domain-containing protein n=1 Tax=Steinernema glaseri TaxID=37863 RepID=A0A1I8A0G5_9BILA
MGKTIPMRKGEKKSRPSANDKLRQEVAKLEKEQDTLFLEQQRLHDEVQSASLERHNMDLRIKNLRTQFVELATSNFHIQDHYSTAMVYEKTKIEAINNRLAYIKDLREFLLKNGIDPGKEKPREEFLSKKIWKVNKEGKSSEAVIDVGLRMELDCGMDCCCKRFNDDVANTELEMETSRESTMEATEVMPEVTP